MTRNPNNNVSQLTLIFVPLLPLQNIKYNDFKWAFNIEDFIPVVFMLKMWAGGDGVVVDRAVSCGGDASIIDVN